MDTLRTTAAHALEMAFVAVAGILFVLVVVAFWLAVAGAAALGLWEMWGAAIAITPAVQHTIASLFPSWDAWSVFATVAGAVLACTLPFVFTCMALIAGVVLMVDNDGLDDAIPFPHDA